ncbi:SDR family oxidoreductase [Stutzerimonas xanthomarina]|uniref:SDR family oxidoreductase n=1 Tax=Stutzerimonas xanthomarina TaxID=271420 RepID=A0A3R8VYU7_9GAMM|nr:NAD-dependent epimerase/dehydratase family protein [Stutzerimonas xanthomarina]RRV12933.1 SDR family oxidoreductase [Stutzerimonas xanthomarina]
MNKVALLTGVTGFIGGELARRLIKEGWSIAIVVRSESDLSFIEDVQEKATTHLYNGTTRSLITIIAEVKPDVVFHLASLFLVDHAPDQVAELISSNVLFGTQLLEAMVICDVKNIVNTGTGWQNYHCDNYRAVNLYAATKQAFEDILDFYVDKYSLSSVTLKLFDTYGPNDKRRKLIRLMVDAIKNGEELGVSPGDQVIDISHVDDVVEHFLQAGIFCMTSELNSSQKYFISGERFTIKELASTIELVISREASIIYGARPYRDREVMYLPSVKDRMPPWNDSFVRRSIKQGVLALLT